MARTTTKPRKKTKGGAEPLNGRLPDAPVGDVLTLAEAAAYLRLPESEVTNLVNTQGLPGRAMGEEWRFFKTALQDWLRCVPPAPKSKDALSSVGGPCWDDPMEIEYRKELSRIRGRDLFEGL